MTAIRPTEVFRGTLTEYYLNHRTNVMQPVKVVFERGVVWVLLGRVGEGLGLSSAHISPQGDEGASGQVRASNGRELGKVIG
jgi:hypothetical protein